MTSNRRRVLVAMSGGVDSSVAAALVAEQGHDVVGVTMKLWGGDSDSGCCSVSDVEDARRVADQLGIEHHVFNFGDDFDAHVVDPYVESHAAGLTPNPCIECNRHLKFDRLMRRADALGFDAVATGHHARIVEHADGRRRIARGVDRLKDQSYVLHMLGQDVLARTLLPIGDLTKAEVRTIAERIDLRTADKPDSQDVCFITRVSGRSSFLADRMDLHPAEVVDEEGSVVGEVPAVELVTVGQRKGLGVAGRGEPVFAVDVDVSARRVTIGSKRDLLSDEVTVDEFVWVDEPLAGGLLAQASAHGEATPVALTGSTVRWERPRRRIAPGQSLVLYQGDEVVAGGIVTG